jgi:hypothetical protein
MRVEAQNIVTGACVLSVSFSVTGIAQLFCLYSARKAEEERDLWKLWNDFKPGAKGAAAAGKHLLQFKAEYTCNLLLCFGWLIGWLVD